MSLLDDIYKLTERRSLGDEDIQNRFGFHKGTEITGPQHQEIRRLFTNLATHLDILLPPGRAKSVAFTELESSAMWANKAIAEMAPVVKE